MPFVKEVLQIVSLGDFRIERVHAILTVRVVVLEYI